MNASLIAATTASTPVAASKAVIVQSDGAVKTDFHQLLRQASSGGSAGRPLSEASNATPASSPQWLQSTLQSATEQQATKQPATEASPETPASSTTILVPDTDTLPESGKTNSSQQASVNIPTYTADTKDIVSAAETSATGAASALTQTTVHTSGASGKSTRGESGKMNKQAALAPAGKRADASQAQPQDVSVLAQSAPQAVVIAQWSAAPSLSSNVSSSSDTELHASLETALAAQQGSSYTYKAVSNGHSLDIATSLPQGSTGTVPHDGTPVTDVAAIHAANTSLRNGASAPVSPSSTALAPEGMGNTKDDAAILPANVTDTTTPNAAAPWSPALPIDLTQVATPAQSTASVKDAAILPVNTAVAANQTSNASPDLPPELAQVATSAGSTASATQVLSVSTAKATTQPSQNTVSKLSNRARPQVQNNVARNRTSRGAVSDTPLGESLETSPIKTKTTVQDISAKQPETAIGAVVYAREGDSASSSSARIGRKKVDTAVKSAPDTNENSPSVSAGTELGGSASATLVASGAHLAPIAQVAATSPITSAATDASLSASAMLQSVQGVPSAPAHAAQSSASPAFAAHASPQSAPVAEPSHALDAAQLHVRGDVAELKVSVQLPGLGKVEVRAVNTHDVTTAHITAAHDALPVFAAGRSGLEEVLKLHDVTLGSLSSPTQGQSNGQSSQQSFNGHAQPQNSATLETTIDAATEEADRPGILPDHTSISVRA